MALVEEKVNDLILEKKQIEEKIYLQNELHRSIVGEFEIKIKMLNKDIFKSCKHDWVFESGGYQERSCHYCNICGCYK